jgi:hypothetical protein
MILHKLTEERVLEIYEYIYNNKGRTKCEYAREFGLSCIELDMLRQGHTDFMDYFTFLDTKK